MRLKGDDFLILYIHWNFKKWYQRNVFWALWPLNLVAMQGAPGSVLQVW